MALDLSSLRKALASLERGIDRAHAAPHDEELRDAVIQRFEYSFELCWKMLRRHLEQVVAHPGAVDQWSFRELMREAAERGLIAAVEPWVEFRHQRSLTSHVYDENRAHSIYKTARQFAGEAKALLAELEHRNVD